MRRVAWQDGRAWQKFEIWAALFFIHRRVPPNVLTVIGRISIELCIGIKEMSLVSAGFEIICRQLGVLLRFDGSREVLCLSDNFFTTSAGTEEQLWLPASGRVNISTDIVFIYFWRGFLERNVSRNFPNFDPFKVPRRASWVNIFSIE